MAQELIDKIRAAAQAKGIDPEVALRIARAESAVNPGAQAKTSSAGGLFQVVDKTWKEFGGAPGKRFDPDENIRVGTDIIASNTNSLKKFLNRDPRPAEVYAAHYFGPTGAKSFLTAEPGTPMESLFSKDVIKANPNLKGKTSDQVMATLEKKMGGAPAAPVVSRETPPAPREALPPSLPPMAAAGAATVAAAPTPTPTQAPMKEQVANLGPGYQAALALSFLADTDEKEDRDIDREPGIAEKWLAEQSTRPSVMAQFSDLSIKSPFAEPQQPQMLAEGGEVGDLTPEEIAAASKPAFLTPKSGKGRQISTKTGELEAAALQGVTETPYNLFGAPVDLATMVMRPFGYDVEKPIGGSEDLKERALKAGIRQKPPEGKAARALYELTQAGSGLVNPAAPVRGAVAAAEKVGDAARMLEDMTVGNIQRGQVRRAGAQAENIPDTAYDPLRERMEASGNLAYAVRNKATPFVMSNRPDTSVDGFIMSMNKPETLAFREKYPDINFFDEAAMKTTKEYQNFTKPIDQAEYLVKYGMPGNYEQREMLKQDPVLEKWFLKAVPHYLRTDFATPEDPLVKAAEKGLLLHLEPKVLPRNFVRNPIDQQSLAYTRETEGFPKSGMAKEDKTNFAKRVEDKIDSSVYPATVADIFNPAQIPPSLRNSVETNPEARVMDFSPDVLAQLQLPQMRDKMLEIRALGPKGEYSAYSQPAAKVPDEFLLPDKVLGMMNMATASNRVARFTRWEDETRQAMATTALRTDPRFERQPLQDGKFVAVVLPDPVKNPELKKLVTDVGCDGGWCTKGEKFAEDYGSGGSRLHVIVSGEGKQARPAAQFAVENNVQKGSNNGVPFEIPKVSITEIRTVGNGTNFADSPALPAIQQYVQSLDNRYGGLVFVDNLKSLGMTQLPKNPMDLLTMGVGFNSRKPLAEKFGTEQAGLAAVRDEVIKLNNGSQYTAGNLDDVAELVRQATRNVLTPQQRATGGMVERQSTDSRKYL